MKKLFIIITLIFACVAPSLWCSELRDKLVVRQNRLFPWRFEGTFKGKKIRFIQGGNFYSGSKLLVGSPDFGYRLAEIKIRLKDFSIVSEWGNCKPMYADTFIAELENCALCHAKTSIFNDERDFLLEAAREFIAQIKKNAQNGNQTKCFFENGGQR